LSNYVFEVLVHRFVLVVLIAVIAFIALTSYSLSILITSIFVQTKVTATRQMKRSIE
jgi:hypothetical protein